MKKMRKILALVLCLIMCFGMLPTWALAEDVTPVEEPAAEMMQEETQEIPEAEQAEESETPTEEVSAYEEPASEDAAMEEPTPEPAEEAWPEETPDAAESAMPEEPEVPAAENNGSSEAENAPENTESTEPAIEPDVQGPSESNVEETAAIPVAVIFTVTPAEAELLVYTKDEYDEKMIIDPEEDSSYLLVPGEYFYTLTAEGYVCVEEEKLQVEPSKEPTRIELTLLPVQAEDGLENTEKATLQKAEEVEETATLMAASGTYGKNLTWILNDEGKLTISGTGGMADSSLLALIPWDAYRTQIITVTIEDGVTSIGQNAFKGCGSLTSVEIPESVTRIGAFAFQECSKLMDIEIPVDVASIEPYVFLGCNRLTDITIPAGVSSIGAHAFDGCGGLIDITIQARVDSIGPYAFSGCRGLTDITIPESVRSIGEGVFYGCSGLMNVTIPAGVTGISSYTFSGCDGLTSVTLPGGLTSIGMSAFDGCSGLIGVTIPEKVTNIGNSAFSDCSGLTSVKIPAGVTSIGNSTFSNCSGLASVIIPEGVTSIGEYAFDNCTQLTDVYYSGEKNQWDKISIRNNNDPLNSATIHYGIVTGTCGENLTWTLDDEGTLTISGIGAMNYNNSSSAPWDPYDDFIKKVTISNGVTSIGEYAFNGCSSLMSIEIPEGVANIGKNAFRECSSLTSVEIPEGVTSIGDYTFENCNSLTSVTIPESVTSIGKGAFRECSSLTSVEIPEGVTSIGDYTFFECFGLTSVTIPESVTSIGENAFYYCSSLTSVAIPESVTSIGENAFYYCSNLTSVVIPSSVTSIGDCAFSSCDGLTNVEISTGVKNIGSDTFSYCSSLTSVTIPEGVTSIGSNAFSSCFGLTSVKIPASVTSIGSGAFSGCSDLTSIEIPENVTKIEDYTFSGCSSMTTVMIPENVTSIGKQAFYNCSQLSEVYYGGSWIRWYKIEKSTGNEALIRATIHNAKETITGTCGDDLIWTLNDNGTLIISGTGAVPNYPSSSGAPWYSYCSSIKTVTIEEGLINIGAYAFSDCTSLKSIIIPESITSIGEYAFYNCSQLSDVYYSGTKSQWGNIDIDSLTFNDYLKEATIHYAKEPITGTCGDNLSWILDYEGTLTISGAGTMWSWTSQSWNKNYIKKVVIEPGVTSIGYSSFSGCTGLTEITIPASIESIGGYAFDGCSSLQDVYFGGSEARKNYLKNKTDYNYGEGTNTVLYNATWYYAEGEAGWDQCGANVWWKYDSTTRALAIKGEGDMWAFHQDEYPSELNYPAPWSDYAGKIVTVTIEEGVTSISDYCFYGLNRAKEFRIPSSIRNVGKYAFYNCASLTGFRLPAEMVEIGDYLFYGCSSLQAIEIPSMVTRIGNGAFRECSNLKEITIPEGVTSIGNGAFENCSSLTKVAIPNVISCGSNPFYGCSGLTTAGPMGGGYDLEFSWTTEIPDFAFSGCTRLKLAVLPDSLTKLGRESFSNCYGLEEIPIPVNVKEIGERCFSWCHNLKDIYFLGGSPNKIGNNSFESVTATAYYPDDGSWWEEDLLNYGGTLTWVAVSQSRVIYDANGGTGAPATQDKTYGVPLALSMTIPTRESSTFLGWSRNPDATEGVYQPGDLFRGEGEVTLYAVWHREIPIDETHFPDENFRKVVKAFDQNGDGYLNDEEIHNVRVIDCRGKSITSLEGITCFEHLSNLSCSDNRISNLDINGLTELQFLQCDNNQLTRLDLSGLTNLQHLECGRNQLTDLNISGLTSLRYLHCSNNQLTKLDASGLTELQSLYCEMNQLTNLTIGGLEKLQTLSCGNNQLTNLDVSTCVQLQQLAFDMNQISSVNLRNCTQLKSLQCSGNKMKELDVSKCPNLEVLIIYSNQLTRLDLTKNTKLNTLDCFRNDINELDLRSSTDLVDIVRNGKRNEISNGNVIYRIGQQSSSVSFDTKTKILPTIFSDNGNPDAYFHDAVYWAVDNGITSGKTATTFAPYDSCTRAQVMSFLYKAKGSPEVSGSNPFTDVKESDYFYKPVLWAVSQGITSGTSATTFSPYNPCTRAQVMSFLYKAMGSPEVSGSNPFTDVKESDYFYKPVLWAVSRGITNGTSATTFGPYNTCTRAQVMTFLYTAMN